ILRHVTFETTLVTVLTVDISPDLKNAHVFVSAIGSDAQKKAAIAKLDGCRQTLQHALMKRVVLKYTPQLHFKLDESIERGDRVLEILEKIEIPPDDEHAQQQR